MIILDCLIDIITIISIKKKGAFQNSRRRKMDVKEKLYQKNLAMAKKGLLWGLMGGLLYLSLIHI